MDRMKELVELLNNYNYNYYVLDNPIIILDCFMYAIYMMPSFLTVMAILLLVIAAMSYAG